ncbi:hypothetical protein D1007_43360 [Hordeum vulgare]|nr:hypothetical protein D1007_43360 [Hordeum vulgare]
MDQQVPCCSPVMVDLGALPHRHSSNSAPPVAAPGDGGAASCVVFVPQRQHDPSTADKNHGRLDQELCPERRSSASELQFHCRSRFQDVLAYFENCNDSLNHEQAKSEQLEHELEKSLQACRDLRSSKGETEVTHDKLKRDFEVLLLECKNVKGDLVKTSKIYEELQSTHEKSLIATYSSHIVDDTCTSNPISFEVSTLKENVELRAQLDLLTSNYGKLEENHVMLTSSHADLLTSHNVQKLAHEAIITKVTSSEPHVDNGTTSSQSTIFPCASPRNSSTHNVATSCDELLSLPCCSNIEAYTSSSTCIDTNRAEEIEELKAQVTSLKKDLEQCHEGTTGDALDARLTYKEGVETM